MEGIAMKRLTFAAIAIGALFSAGASAATIFQENFSSGLSLIDLMRLEKDQSLTVQEKAERAQRLHDEITARQQDRP
jgi:hypothetical protein